jgi:hypothetical protein
MTLNPDSAKQLSVPQCGFLHHLASRLHDVPWEEEALRNIFLDSTRLTPIDEPSALTALYEVLLGADTGPEVGKLLSSQERNAVVRACREVPSDELEFLQATGLPVGVFERWLISEKPKMTSITARYRSIEEGPGDSIVEFLLGMTDGKTHCRRVLLGEGKVEESAQIWIRELESQMGSPITFSS